MSQLRLIPRLRSRAALLCLTGALGLCLTACGGSSHAPSLVRSTQTSQVQPSVTHPSSASTSRTGASQTIVRGGSSTTAAQGAPKASSNSAIPNVTTPAKGVAAGPVSVPVTYTVKRRRLIPPGLTVSPHLPILLTAVSADAKRHRLLVEVPPHGQTLVVPAHGRVVLHLPGLASGTYGITVDGRVAGGIIAGSLSSAQGR
jgi:hypothetical protein